MNTLIDKLMKEGIMYSPFENWQDENSCLAKEYVVEHYGANPYGELGQLIAEQAMDDHRTKLTFAPDQATIDEASFAEASARGGAEIDEFMGFNHVFEEEHAFEDMPTLCVYSKQNKLFIKRTVQFSEKGLECFRHLLAV